MSSVDDSPLRAADGVFDFVCFIKVQVCHSKSNVLSGCLQLFQLFLLQDSYPIQFFNGLSHDGCLVHHLINFFAASLFQILLLSLLGCFQQKFQFFSNIIIRVFIFI